MWTKPPKAQPVNKRTSQAAIVIAAPNRRRSVFDRKAVASDDIEFEG